MGGGLRGKMNKEKPLWKDNVLQSKTRAIGDIWDGRVAKLSNRLPEF